MIDPRCDYCGCLRKYQARPFQESLATPEQQRALREITRGLPDGDEAYRAAMEAYGYREVWLLSYTCPGCGCIGTDGTQLKREEAEGIAALQNETAGTPEALEEARQWEREVRRRSDRDARHFADYCLTRFPEWTPFLRFISAEEAGSRGEERPIKWKCALILCIPTENPRVNSPLDVRVYSREVILSWGDWHTHVSSDLDREPTDPEHLQRAVLEVEKLVTEQWVTCQCYKGEKHTSGCWLPIDMEPRGPWELMDPDHPAYGDRMELRSWRGTYDREIHRPTTTPNSP